MQRIMLLFANKAADTKPFTQNLTFHYCPRRTFRGSETQRRKKVIVTSGNVGYGCQFQMLAPRTAVPTQETVGTSEPAALQDMADFTAAGHFHLPVRQVAATRHVFNSTQSANDTVQLDSTLIS